MSRLLFNSTPASRMRGCVFAENFENDQKVVQNGATITGAPQINRGATFDGTNDYITYAYDRRHKFTTEGTLSLWVKITDPTATKVNSIFDSLEGVTAGQFYVDVYNSTIRWVAGNNSKRNDTAFTSTAWVHVMITKTLGEFGLLYLNGVLEDATLTTQAFKLNEEDILIGNRKALTGFLDGQVRDVRLFNTALTAQEALDFYNNDTYNYRNQAVLDLPMRAQDHDPTNVRTLDVSGNENHAEFGDGSTPALYPTKLQKRGYITDGHDYIQTDNNLFTDTGYLTMAVLCSLVTRGNQIICSIDDGSGDISGILQYYGDSGDWRFYSGGGGNVNAASLAGIPNSQIVTLIGVYDGTNTKIYVNGEVGTDAATPLSPEVTNSMKLTILAFGNLTQDLTKGARVLQQLNFDSALTPLQVADLHLNMMKRVNTV